MSFSRGMLVGVGEGSGVGAVDEEKGNSEGLGRPTLEDMAAISADGAWRASSPCHYPVKSTATACEGNWHLEAVEWGTIGSLGVRYKNGSWMRNGAEKSRENWQATKVTQISIYDHQIKNHARMKYRIIPGPNESSHSKANR